MRIKRFEDTSKRSWFTPFVTRDVEFERRDPLALQIDHFVAVIRGEAKPLVTARDGLENLRVVEAIVEATKTGAVVDTQRQEASRS